MGILNNNILVILIITAVELYEVCSSFCATNRTKSCKVDDKASLSLIVEDRLCELPDEVLSYILSFLSLRDVARMTTLSRNWRKVCSNLARLDLDWFVMSGKKRFFIHNQECQLYCQAYVKSVDQVLRRYRDQNIFSFRLSCCLNKSYGGNIDRWISYVAAYKGLQSLWLQFSCAGDGGKLFFLPEYAELHLITGSFLSQFSCLEDLHLNTCILRFQNDFVFNKVITLDLCDVILEGTQWQDFLSSFSTIENLLLRMCNLPNKLCIGDNFPRLSFLVVGLCLELQELELRARNLKKFDLFSKVALKCIFSDVPYLESVYLFLVNGSASKNILNNLAASVSSLKYLCIREYPPIHKPLSHPAKLFHSVLSLRVCMSLDDGNIMMALPHILKSFPLLEKLEIKLPGEPVCKMHEISVQYIHTKLKEVELSHFQIEWIPVATYLLKSAIMLDRMVLTKSSKDFCGAESWQAFKIIRTLSNKDQKCTQNALIGKASSMFAEVIIK